MLRLAVVIAGAVAVCCCAVGAAVALSAHQHVIAGAMFALAILCLAIVAEEL